jgi:hypothetical protein
MNRHRRDVETLFHLHSEFERTKTSRKMQKVADGVHRPAIYNMRVALAQMAAHLDGLPMDMTPLVHPAEFFHWILSSYATRADRRLPRALQQKIARWQELYIKLARRVSTLHTWDKTVALLHKRAVRINHDSRVTGNALINIVDQILRYRRRGLSDAEIQAAIDDFIASQTLDPDFRGAGSPGLHPPEPILRSFLSLVQGYREDI